METSTSPPTDVSRDYLAALGDVRAWKTFFLMLVLLAVLTHVGAFVAVRHFGVLSGKFAAEEVPATQPESARAIEALSVALPMMEFVGRVAALLLAVAMLVAAFVALCGRLPASGFIRGFFWSIIVFALLLPWERLTPRAARLPGVFTDVAALESAMPDATAAATGFAAQAPLYLRFAAYPFAAVLLLLYANGSFRRSHRDALARPGGNIPMRVV